MLMFQEGWNVASSNSQSNWMTQMHLMFLPEIKLSNSNLTLKYLENERVSDLVFS